MSSPIWASVPDAAFNRLDRITAAHELAAYLAADRDPLIVAGLARRYRFILPLLVTGPAEIVEIGSVRFEFIAAPASAPPSTAGCRIMRCMTRGR
jgi:hypothetical protein